MHFRRCDQRSIAHLLSFDIDLSQNETFEDGNRLLIEARTWCEERWPRDDHTDRTRWYVHGWTIRFRNEDDAFEFRMRWC